MAGPMVGRIGQIAIKLWLVFNNQVCTTLYLISICVDIITIKKVSSMDESIGRILDALKELKLEEETLVIFTSDNGPEVIICIQFCFALQVINSSFF